MNKFAPYTPPASNGPAISWFMVGMSGLLHLAMVAGLAAISFSFVATPPPKFAISVATAPLQRRDLPPLSGSKEAGAPGPRTERVAPPQPKREEPKPEPPKPEPKKETPKPEPKKPEPKKEAVKPVVKEQPKAPADTEIISTKSSEEAEPAPQPRQPTPREVAQELEGRRDVFRAKSGTAEGTNARYIASDGDPGGGGGPDLYRSVLVGLIGGNWVPPYVRRGEVRDATVEFTVYSPPLPRNAVNQVRTARITNVRIIKSSGDLDYDSLAMEAVRSVRQWPPLPDSYRKETLVVQCRFYMIGEE